MRNADALRRGSGQSGRAGGGRATPRCWVGTRWLPGAGASFRGSPPSPQRRAPACGALTAPAEDTWARRHRPVLDTGAGAHAGASAPQSRFWPIPKTHCRAAQRLSGSRVTSSSRYRLWLMNETKQLPWLGRDNATRFLAVLGPSLGFCAHADRHERALRAHSECANSYSVGDNEPHGSHGRKRRSQPDSSNPRERRVIEHHETPRARRADGDVSPGGEGGRRATHVTPPPPRLPAARFAHRETVS